MRPIVPDRDSVKNPVEKLEAARSVWVARVDLDHCDFVLLTVLNRS